MKRTNKRLARPIDFHDHDHARLQTDQLTIFEVIDDESGILLRTACAASAQGFARRWSNYHPSTRIRARLATLAPLQKAGDL